MNPYLLTFFFVVAFQSIVPKPPLTYITVDLEQTTVEVFESHWSINIPCEARVGECVFEYTLLPGGWSYEGNKINIPLEDAKKTVNYVVNAKISDPTGQQIQKSFIIQIDGGQIQVFEQQIFYKNNLRIPPSVKPEPIFKISDPSPISNENGKPNPAQQTNRQMSTFQFKDILHPLKGVPSLEQINTIIERGDIVEIVQTIQEVITAEADCQAKIDYLNSVIGQLENHIYHNKQRIIKGDAILKQMKKEVHRLQSELWQMKEVMGEKKMEDMKEKMKKVEEQREKSYSDYKLNEKIRDKYLNKMNEVKDEKYETEGNETELQISISVDELELQKVNELLEITVGKKKMLEDRIEQNKKIMQATKTIKTRNENQMDHLEKKAKEYSEITIQHKIKYLDTDYEMKTLKREMEEAARTSKNMKERIEVVEAEIETQKATIDEEEIDRLKILIQILEESLPSVQKKANELYYQCSGLDLDQEPEANATKSTLIFFAKPNAFVNYLYNTYGINDIYPLQQQNLRPISIFSPEWSQLYGVPYPGFGVTIKTSTSQFSCESGSQMLSGFGIIQKITHGIIVIIGRDGIRYTLNSGVCTRLENTDKGFPNKGQQIFWRGKLMVFNTINLYSATFY